MNYYKLPKNYGFVAPSKQELSDLRIRIETLSKYQSIESVNLNLLKSQLSCESVLPHHLLTMKHGETSLNFYVMVHVPSCIHPKMPKIEHLRSDGIGAQILGSSAGAKFNGFPYDGKVIRCELVAIEHAEVWQIHGDLKKPPEIDTSNRPNYTPYHHGGE